MTVGQRLVGKVALISGGASGIGAETARRFAEHGAAVMIGDIDQERGNSVVTEIEQAGGTARFVPLDAADEVQWQDAVAGTRAAFGNLTILANIAGVSGRNADGSPQGPIESMSLETWNRVMDINSTGVFLGMKHAIASMRAAGGGSIINISSIYGVVGSPHSAAYHASKGAVRTVTKTAAIQYASENIRVNSVHPGFVSTPMTQFAHDDPDQAAPRLSATPLGRFGTPYDIAMGCVYLASDESHWMTGAELVIDGGMLAQ